MPQYHGHNTHTYTVQNNMATEVSSKHEPFIIVRCLQESAPSGLWVSAHFLPFALMLASPLLILLSAETLQVCVLYVHTLGSLFSQQGLAQAQKQYDLLVFFRPSNELCLWYGCVVQQMWCKCVKVSWDGQSMQVRQCGGNRLWSGPLWLLFVIIICTTYNRLL